MVAWVAVGHVLLQIIRGGDILIYVCIIHARQATGRLPVGLPVGYRSASVYDPDNEPKSKPNSNLYQYSRNPLA